MRTRTLICVADRREIPKGLKLTNDDRLVVTGIGQINAAVALTRAINQYKPSRVLNVGTCGAVKGNVGDIVRVVGAINGFQEEFRKKSPQLLFGVTGMYNSLIYTSDYFITKETCGTLYEGYKLFDMECYALARVCLSFGIRFAAKKVISDTFDEACKPVDWKDKAGTLQELVAKTIRCMDTESAAYIIPWPNKIMN